MISKSSYSDAAVIAWTEMQLFDRKGLHISRTKTLQLWNPSSSPTPHKNGNKKGGKPFKH